MKPEVKSAADAKRTKEENEEEEEESSSDEDDEESSEEESSEEVGVRRNHLRKYFEHTLHVAFSSFVHVEYNTSRQYLILCNMIEFIGGK